MTLRVVSGNPTPDEIAAVRLAITTLQTRAVEPVLPAMPAMPMVVGGWSDPDESLRRASGPALRSKRFGWASTVW